MSHSLLSCSCGGFVPEAAARCPHCSASRVGRVVRGIAALAGAITLMACYGAMPSRGDYPQPEGCQDGDADGVCVEQDCNDGDPQVFPGTEDTDGDGVDQNCDGTDGWRDPGEVAAPAPDAGSLVP